MLNVAKEAEGIGTRNESVLLQRIRIPIKSIYRNEAMCNDIGSYFDKIKGIHYIKANPLTAKVLVIYDERIITEGEIEKNLYNYLRKLSSSRIEEGIIKINRMNFNEEISTALAELPYSNDKLPSNGKGLWHYINRNKIKNYLNTDYNYGLSKLEVHKRTKEAGLNVLSEKKRKSLIKKIIENLNDTSTKLLLGVSGISFLLGHIVDAVAVLGIVIVETFFSVLQQHKAENSILSLKDMLVNKALVIRDGIEHEIEAKRLVPGDIILIEAGDKVPADARIIECTDLKTSEASLTGESTAIIKNCSECNKYTELGDRSNMIYMGTDVVGGRGKAVIVATGMRTEIGKIATMLQGINNESTPLQRRMLKFTSKLTKYAFIFSLGAAAVGLLTGRSLGQVLTLAVSFSIGALPESLPAVVTVAMGISVQRLSQRNVIVKKINAVETLGCANVICCDKTGTLTMNEMTVKQLYVDNSLYGFTGSGYNPSGKIRLIEGEPNKEKELEKLLTCGVLCNNSKLTQVEKGKWSIQGDPTEGAIVTAARKIGLNEDLLREEYCRVKEIPFDSDRRCMTVIVKEEEGYTAYCKGSFTSVIDKCSTIYDNGKIRLFTSTDKERITRIRDEMTDEALRVLAFAYKKLDSKGDNINNNFTFLGFSGMEDPPRPGAREAIKKCHKASIKVVMITGDNKNTAAAIGKQLGLLNHGLVLSGAELEDMTDEELDSKIRDIQVFARTSPKQKLRIVKAFKRFGYVVAMTGDGVNDAPAIKEANIGIAMGKNGSDVARDSADIVLVDDKFSTIVTAVLEGRATSNNIKNTMKYLLAGSLGEIIAIGACAIAAGTLPLLSIQILWINVICETIMGSTIALEPPSEEVMENKPEKKDAPLIYKKMGTEILRRSLGIGLSSFGLYSLYNFLGGSPAKARTMAFSNLICSQIVNAYGCRGNKKSLPHRYMNRAAVACIAMLAGILYIPFLSSIFGTVSITGTDWLMLGGASALSRI
jgi:Ca2+-transporting ATPase